MFSCFDQILYILYSDFMRNIHAAELQAVSISLVVRHQVIVVEKSDPEHCGVDTDAQEEDADKAHHLVERNRTSRKRRQVSYFNTMLDRLDFIEYIRVYNPQ